MVGREGGVCEVAVLLPACLTACAGVRGLLEGSGLVAATASLRAKLDREYADLVSPARLLPRVLGLRVCFLNDLVE